MRKCLYILIISSILITNIFCQGLPNSPEAFFKIWQWQRDIWFSPNLILAGDTNILDKYVIFDGALAKLQMHELRYLRNMIYARYGYIFSSEDLTEYFTTRFNWYKGTMKNVDLKLTEIDRKNINKIRLFETMRETKKGVIFDKSRLTGLWHKTVEVAAGYDDHFIFFDDKHMGFYISEMNPYACIYSLEGNYEIKGNILFFLRNAFIVSTTYDRDRKGRTLRLDVEKFRI